MHKLQGQKIRKGPKYFYKKRYKYAYALLINFSDFFLEFFLENIGLRRRFLRHKGEKKPYPFF